MFTKKYFQDRTILLLNMGVIIGAVINVVSILLRINTSQSVTIIRYQVSLGLDGYQRANVIQLYSFAVAAILVALMAMLISAKIYHRRRILSVLVLALSLVALFFNLLVSGAILNLQ